MLEDCCPDPGTTDRPTVSAQCCVSSEASVDLLRFIPVPNMAFTITWMAEPHVFAVHPLLPVQVFPSRSLSRPPPLLLADRLAGFAAYRI
jgi:hypothetical protein